MEKISERSDCRLSLSKVVRIDQICHRFDQAIHVAIQNQGPWPNSDDYLSDTTEPVRCELRKQLLAVEASYRKQHVENVDATGSARPAEVARSPLPDPDASPSGESTLDRSAVANEASDDRRSHIGRYRVEMVLGSGGFGKVYRCYDDALKRSVAVKVPHRSRLDSPELDLEEARVLARLEHPAIVPVYDVGRDEDGRPYSVMEYVEGQSLKDSLAAELPSPAWAAELIATIAEAIDHAHRHGFVHRNLKPGNILLDSVGTPHVLDFALAIHEVSQRDRPGEMAGTPAYMAPEQVGRESHRLDARADIWALGVMLYEMLTGRRPFDGSDKTKLCDEILHREPKPPRQFNEAIPEPLEQVCLKCLQKDISHRYLTARDLSRDLRGWNRPRVGWPVWAVAGVVAVLLVATGIWYAAWTHDRSPGAQTTASSLVGASTASLQGTVDVLVWDPNDKARSNLSVRDLQARPLRARDQIRVKFELTRPAYAYLLWIDGRGKVLPVYPWRPGDWSSRPQSQPLVDRLSLPAELDRGWPMDGTAGMETIVLLARETPLTAEINLERLVAGFQPQTIRDSNALVEFDGGRMVAVGMEHSRSPKFFKPEEIDDPVLQTQQLLTERLRGQFELTRAVSFAKRGE